MRQEDAVWRRGVREIKKKSCDRRNLYQARNLVELSRVRILPANVHQFYKGLLRIVACGFNADLKRFNSNIVSKSLQ